MRRSSPVLSIAGAVLAAAASASSAERTVTRHDDPGYVPQELLADYTHLTARLRIDPWQRRVSGTAEFAFRAIRERTEVLEFWAPGIDVSSATVNGNAAAVERHGEALAIRPNVPLEFGSENTVALSYEAVPATDLFFIGWDDPTGTRRKQVWAHRPFRWLPYVQDRLTTDVHVTFPAPYLLFTNGERVSVVDDPQGTRTWHYRMTRDHPFFSTCLVAGEYAYRTLTTKGGVPVELWYYPDQEDRFDTAYAHTLEMFDFIERELGVPYPYPLYRQGPVTDYLFAGMETTTSTVFGDFLFVDPRGWYGRNFVNVNVHELVHQWFGNGVHHQADRDTWLTEGITTYYAKQFERSVFGDDSYQTARRTELEKVLDVSAKETYPMASGVRATPILYQKGSLVLDMLRDELGDAEFRSVMRDYFRAHAFGEAKTSDLLASVRRVTGRTLDGFFDQWVERGGEPHFRVAYAPACDAEGRAVTQVTVDQIQTIDALLPVFRVPLVVEVHYADGSSDRVRQRVEDRHAEILVPNPDRKTVAFVLFDPGASLLKRLTFERSVEALRAQLAGAPGMIDRYEALLALRGVDLDAKRDALVARFGRETWHLVKGEIVSQLAQAADSRSIEVVRRAIADRDTLVRRSVVTAVRQVPPSLESDYASLLRDDDYSNVAEALANLAASFPEKVDRYLDATKAEVGWRGRNIRIRWLETALDHGKTKVWSELVDYASPRHEYETRANAIQAIVRLGRLDPIVSDHLIRAALYWNPRVADAASEALRHFAREHARRRIIENALRVAALTPKEETRIRALITP